MFTISLILEEGGLILYPTIFTLYAVYSIVNSQNKLFETVAVSKLYSLINIYLYVFISVSLGTISLLMAVVLFTKLNFTSDITLLVYNFNPILVISCINTIIVCFLLPIFFIKLNSLRKTLTISVAILVPIILLFFKNSLLVSAGLGKFNFWKSIIMIPNYNQFLIIFIYASILIIPISMFIAYKLYKGKRCLKC
jgi:NAD/NADP transhydrogenase beta subunit